MTSWVARVEWETPDPFDGDAIDLVMDHLEPHAGVFGQRLGQNPDGRIWEATVSIDADTLTEAVASAVDVVAGATAETPTGVLVMRDEVFYARDGVM